MPRRERPTTTVIYSDGPARIEFGFDSRDFTVTYDDVLVGIFTGVGAETAARTAIADYVCDLAADGLITTGVLAACEAALVSAEESPTPEPPAGPDWAACWETTRAGLVVEVTPRRLQFPARCACCGTRIEAGHAAWFQRRTAWRETAVLHLHSDLCAALGAPASLTAGYRKRAA